MAKAKKIVFRFLGGNVTFESGVVTTEKLNLLRVKSTKKYKGKHTGWVHCCKRCGGEIVEKEGSRVPLPFRVEGYTATLICKNLKCLFHKAKREDGKDQIGMVNITLSGKARKLQRGKENEADKKKKSRCGKTQT